MTTGSRRVRSRPWTTSVLLLALLLGLIAPAAAAAPTTSAVWLAAAEADLDAWLLDAQPDGPHRVFVTYDAPRTAAEAADGVRGVRGVEVVAAEHVGRTALHVLEVPTVASLRGLLRVLEVAPGVVAVEPDQTVRPSIEVHEILPLAVELAGGNVTPTALPPTWGLHNDGTVLNGRVGRVGIDVGARAAWPVADGDGVVVAVVDTGVDIHHRLLRDRIWTNPGERVDGRDTDGNGFVDDLHGWNFANNDNRVFVSAASDGHGTHVAGIIAAAEVSGSAFQGVAPKARIMPLRFIDGAQGRGSDAVAAIRYAIAHGADVINASWGSPDSSPALRTVLAESPVPVVVSAGNDGQSLDRNPWYPAADNLPTTVVVASVANDGTLSTFSNHSARLVDVAAPGELILSTWTDERLAVSSGTSMAAPFVAGVLALALQHHPSLSVEEAVQAVRDTVRPLVTVRGTVAGGIVRAPALLDHLGTRVSACPGIDPRRLPFTDVNETSPHREAVACLLSRGVTRGVTEEAFGAARGLTRAQIATLVDRTLQEAGATPPVPRRVRFTDVEPTDVHRDAIEALAAVGIVEGRTATSYDPFATTSRAELAAVVARAAEYLAEGEVRVRGPVFADTAGVSDEVWIDKAAGLRIVLGRTPEAFEPNLPVRRDQAASMISRLLDRWVQQGLLTVG